MAVVLGVGKLQESLLYSENIDFVLLKLGFDEGFVETLLEATLVVLKVLEDFKDEDEDDSLDDMLESLKVELLLVDFDIPVLDGLTIDGVFVGDELVVDFRLVLVDFNEELGVFDDDLGVEVRLKLVGFEEFDDFVGIAATVDFWLVLERVVLELLLGDDFVGPVDVLVEVVLFGLVEKDVLLARLEVWRLEVQAPVIDGTASTPEPMSTTFEPQSA